MEALWEAIFPAKKNLPKYRFKQSPHDNATWVEITTGKYTGVVLSYGMVRFAMEFNIPKLNFSYNILYSGEHDRDLLQNDQEFVTIMGDILSEIIIENEPTRTNDFEEPDLQ